MTYQQAYISRLNQQKAREYFGILDDKNLVLHHIDPSWRHDDIERYIQWNIEDLVVMTRAEHTKLHRKLNPIDLSGENNPMFGKKHSEESKEKNRQSHLGKECSDETRERIKQAHLGKHYKSGPTGKHWKIVDGKRVYY